MRGAAYQTARQHGLRAHERYSKLPLVSGEARSPRSKWRASRWRRGLAACGGLLACATAAAWATKLMQRARGPRAP